MHTVAIVVSILLVRVPYSGLGCMGDFRELVALETWFWWFLGLGSVLREYVLRDGRRVLAALLLYLVVVVVIIVMIVTIITIVTRTVVE